MHTTTRLQPPLLTTLSLSLSLLLLLNPLPTTGHAPTNPSPTHHLNNARTLCSALTQRNTTLHCILTQEATEGPYYIPHPLVRSNITDDRPGVPFTLYVNVVDVNTCEPVEGVYVDIWHADALGKYSGWSDDAEVGANHPKFTMSASAPEVESGAYLERRGWLRSRSTSSSDPSRAEESDPNDPHHGPPSDDDDDDDDDDNHHHHGPPGGGGRHGNFPPPHHAPSSNTRWLRGVQQTNSTGTSTFDTIFPGWYDGRTTHMHVRIHSGNASVSEDSSADTDGKHVVLAEAGRTAHTGQFFFGDALVQRIAKTSHPYLEHFAVEEPTLNADDGIFLHSGGGEQVVLVEGAEDGAGLIGYITVGIDPSADRGDGDDDFPGGPHFGKASVLGMVAVVAGAVLGGWGLMSGFRWLKRRNEGYVVLE